jgi:hypothetical protein
MVLATGPQEGKGTTFSEGAMSTVYNPFSIRNNTPKWPDGLANYSVGLKKQFASDIYGRDFVVCLYPGLVNWLQAYSYNEVADRMSLHAVHHARNTGVAFGVNVDPDPYPVQWTYEGYFSYWRITGAACRILSANSDEKCDGWFECIRTSRGNYTHRLGVVGTSVEVHPHDDDCIHTHQRYQLKTGDMVPTDATVQEWMSCRNWALNPSYASGKIKDLEQYIFSLNQTGDSNEFVAMRNVNLPGGGHYLVRPRHVQYTDTNLRPPVLADPPAQQYEDGTTVFFTYSEIQQDGGAVPPTAAEVVDISGSFVSDSWDIILIRLHGIDETRLALHSVCCYEMLCEEGSERSQYETLCYPSTDALEAYKKFQNQFRKIPFWKPPTGQYYE